VEEGSEALFDEPMIRVLECLVHVKLPYASSSDSKANRGSDIFSVALDYVE
jgi:hypothetical protein